MPWHTHTGGSRAGGAEGEAQAGLLGPGLASAPTVTQGLGPRVWDGHHLP